MNLLLYFYLFCFPFFIIIIIILLLLLGQNYKILMNNYHLDFFFFLIRYKVLYIKVYI